VLHDRGYRNNLGKLGLVVKHTTNSASRNTGTDGNARGLVYDAIDQRYRALWYKTITEEQTRNVNLASCKQSRYPADSVVNTTSRRSGGRDDYNREIWRTGDFKQQIKSNHGYYTLPERYNTVPKLQEGDGKSRSSAVVGTTSRSRVRKNTKEVVIKWSYFSIKKWFVSSKKKLST